MRVNMARTQLQCGPCGYIATSENAMDRQSDMTAHWSLLHTNLLPPVFDQNTWRTKMVKELDYSPSRAHAFVSTCGVCGSPVGGDGDICATCAAQPPERPTQHQEQDGFCTKCTYENRELVAWPCAPSLSATTPPTATMTHQRAQVLVREIRGPNKRTKARYQTYVRLPHLTASIYMPTTESLADARAQRDSLHSMLTWAMPGDTVIEIPDYV